MPYLNTIGAAVHYTMPGDDAPYVVTFAVLPDDPAFSLVDYANKLFDQYVAAFGGVELTGAATITKVVASLGQAGQLDPIIAESTRAPHVGTGGTTRLPQNCALLIRKKTAKGGRRYRGRMYLPCALAEAEVDNVGVIGAGTVSAKQTKADLFLSNLAAMVGGTPGSPMVIDHGPFYDYSTEPPTVIGPAPAPTPVTQLVVESLIATQRRRLRR